MITESKQLAPVTGTRYPVPAETQPGNGMAAAVLLCSSGIVALLTVVAFLVLSSSGNRTAGVGAITNLDGEEVAPGYVVDVAPDGDMFCIGPCPASTDAV
jgi:hypothetical protein